MFENCVVQYDWEFVQTMLLIILYISFALNSAKDLFFPPETCSNLIRI